MAAWASKKDFLFGMSYNWGLFSSTVHVVTVIIAEENAVLRVLQGENRKQDPFQRNVQINSNFPWRILSWEYIETISEWKQETLISGILYI